MSVDPSPYTHDGVVVDKLLTDLLLAASASLAQTTLGAPKLTSLWHGRPIDDCCDIICLWVDSFIPIIDFPSAATATDNCRTVELPPKVVLSLRRPCAPIPDSAGNVDPADEQAVASDLIIDARALQCGVASTWPTILQANYPAARLFPEAMVPVGDLDCLGWDWPILIEVIGCKVACST